MSFWRYHRHDDTSKPAAPLWDLKASSGPTRIPIEPHPRLNFLQKAALSRLFYAPRTGFMNSYKLSKKARLYPSMRNVTEAQVKDWYWKQPVN